MTLIKHGGAVYLNQFKGTDMARKPTKNKRVGSKEADLIDAGYMGTEPLAADINSIAALCRAYTWYNRFATREDSVRWLTEFIENHATQYKDIIPNLAGLVNESTYGWAARLHENGKTDIKPVITGYLSEIRGKTAKVILVDELEPVEIKPKAPVDRISEFLPDFEEALDQQSKIFNAYNYLTTRNVPQIYATRIAEYYAPVIAELQEAYDKTDKDCVEAYKFLTKSEINILLKLVKTWVEDVERYLGNTKKERAPRKTRTKSTTQKLKHFRYMPTYDKLKLTSSNPANIFGAKQLFVLNTVSNVLTIFYAKEGGLDVNRSSIDNYDADKTQSKKIGRALEKTIKTVLLGNKKTRENVLETVSTAYIPVTDRLNNNSVLLLIVK